MSNYERSSSRASIERVPAADGARIACKRKATDGPPVIFVHGLAVNADLWDIPELDTADGRFRCLPALLHELDYDIWLVNLRGHGAPHMLSEPPPGQDDWCVDHFVHFDLPAVVEHVLRRTGRRPMLVANSMGAMTAAGWLQGAVLTDNAGEPCIRNEPAEAARRQALLAGCVLLEFPAALRWPTALYDEAGNLCWRELVSGAGLNPSQANFPFELLANAGWLQAFVTAAGGVRLDWLRPGEAGWRGRVPPGMAGALGWIDAAVASAAKLLAERFKGARHFSPETFSQGLLHAVDHMKAGVLMQLGKCVRERAFVSLLGAPDYRYSEHYEQIALPTLLVLGGQDRIANAVVTREAFYDRIRSADKSLFEFPELAHGELEYTPFATREVYPQIVQWIRGHEGSGGRVKS